MWNSPWNARAFRARNAASEPGTMLAVSVSKGSKNSIRTSSPAECASACRSRGRSSTTAGTTCRKKSSRRGTSMPPPDPAATILERERSLLASETRAFATRRRRETTRLLAIQSSLFVVLLVAWWAASGTLVDPLFLSDPITVARALLQIAIDGTLWWHLQWTLIEMTLGYALGVAVGLCLAIAVTAIPWGARILRPVMLGLFAIPKVALAPLVIVWFGIYLVP